MNPNEWLMLDNLAHNWSIGHSLLRSEVQPTIAACERRGWIKDGKITDAGRIALITFNQRKTDK